MLTYVVPVLGYQTFLSLGTSCFTWGPLARQITCPPSPASARAKQKALGGTKYCRDKAASTSKWKATSADDDVSARELTSNQHQPGMKKNREEMT